MQNILETFDAPWRDIEFDVQKKSLQNRRFGVEDRNERHIANYITEKQARLITLAPEMLLLIEQVALDDASTHQWKAKAILEIMGWEPG